jgi:DNA-binding CsgD family transcriptional regulator
MKPASTSDPSLLPRLWADPRLLVVLLVLVNAPGPLTAGQISKILSADPDTVGRKLRRLSALGLATRQGVRGGWLLTRDGWRFMLNPENPNSALSSTDSSVKMHESLTVVEGRVNPNRRDETGQVSRKNRINQQSRANLPAVKTRHAAQADWIREYQIKEEVVSELRRNGISLNARVAEIAGREYITAEYIYAHARRLRRLGKFSTGLLVSVLDNHDELQREDRVHRRDYELYLQEREQRAF